MKRAIVLVLMFVAVLVPLAGANADLKSDQAIPQPRNGASRDRTRGVRQISRYAARAGRRGKQERVAVKSLRRS